MDAGASISNDHTGETLTMLISNEARQLYRVLLPPGRPSPPLHYHVKFTETFKVIEGSLDLYLGRERKLLALNAGDSFTVPIGRPHTFANHRATASLISVESNPAGTVAEAFQLAYAVANEGGASKDGLPKNILLRLLFIRISQGFIPGIPLVFQQAVLSAAFFLSEISGLKRYLVRHNIHLEFK